MSWKKLNNIISKSDNILLSTHKNPDGDGLGSELAMYYHLKSLNKNVQIINISKMADRYTFMDDEGVVEVFDDEVSFETFDLVIVFDLGDFKRLGKIGDNILNNKIDVINIDHHVPRDDEYYLLSIVDIDAPATTYMIWKYFEYLGLTVSPLNDNIAIPLYVGLLNDTGSFRYSGVTSDTHNMASHLLESNVNPNEIFQHVYENRTIGRINLLSKMIEGLKFSINNRVAYAIVDDATFNNAGATISDADGLADFIRSIDGVEVSFCITSLKSTKISLRSRGKYTVNDIAQIFGGGGHYYASGAEIKKEDISIVTDKILNLLRDKM